MAPRMHAVDIWREDRNCVGAALGPQNERQRGPKTTVSHTIKHFGQDCWLRCRGKMNENGCVLQPLCGPRRTYILNPS